MSTDWYSKISDLKTAFDICLQWIASEAFAAIIYSFFPLNTFDSFRRLFQNCFSSLQKIATEHSTLTARSWFIPTNQSYWCLFNIFLHVCFKLILTLHCRKVMIKYWSFFHPCEHCWNWVDFGQITIKDWHLTTRLLVCLSTNLTSGNIMFQPVFNST